MKYMIQYKYKINWMKEDDTMMKIKEEIDAMRRYNEENPENKVEMVIDEFNKEWYFIRNGKRLSNLLEYEILSSGLN